MNDIAGILVLLTIAAPFILAIIDDIWGGYNLD